MAEFRKSAVKITQGKRPLFLAFLAVRDFLADGFYRVDTLDVRESTGMQRVLDDRRAKSFGDDMLSANKKGQAILPTSVFLATGGGVGYDDSGGELFFDSAAHAGVCPLDVVDGQHRIEGLKMAAKKDESILDFPIAAVIAPNLTEAEKMLQFVVVNTKQRTIDPGVAQHIIARFTKMSGVDNLPHIPRWLAKAAEKGDDDKALDIAKTLNSDEQSPWRGRIQFADEAEKQERHTITQAAFCRAVKKYLLTPEHPLRAQHADKQKQMQILINFWTAVENLFVARSDELDEGARSVVFGFSGMAFFLLVFYPVLRSLGRKKDFTVATMEKSILSAGGYLPPDMAEVMSPDFWRRGGGVSQWNTTAVEKAAARFADAFLQAADNDIAL